MVAKYDRPAEVLRDWARPYMTSNPEVFAEFEDLADSVDAIAAKLSDLVGYDLDEINKAAAALSCSTVDDTLHARTWGEEHSAHVADLVELAKSYDTFAGILRDQSYASTDVPERRKMLFQTARKARAFGDLLDVVLVGPTGNDPDFEGFDKALRDPEEDAWKAWLKTFVAGLVEFRDASLRRMTTSDDAELAREQAQRIDGLNAEVARLKEELIDARTKASKRAYALEQIRVLVVDKGEEV